MFSFLCMLVAQAQMFSLEPQIRTGIGVSWNDGAMGFSATMDSRMTQLMYVSLGAFRSLETPVLPLEEDDAQTWVALRHGIWAAPGLRFPHRYAKEGFNWDFLLRGGFGATFSDLANEEDSLLMEPAFLYGADVLLFGDKISCKLAGKMFMFNPYVPEFRSKVPLMRPQLSIELAYTW